MKNSSNIPNFDLNNVYEVETNTDVNGFVVKSEGYDNSNVKWSIGFYGTSEDIESAIIFKYTIVSDSETIIEQFDSSYNLLIKVKLDSTDESVVILETYNQNEKTQDWGRDTGNCMADLYSNHGWLSVGLMFASAYQPWVVASVAGACAVHTF